LALALDTIQTDVARRIVKKELGYVNSFLEKYKKEEKEL